MSSLHVSVPAVGRSLVRLFIISQSAVDGEEEEEEDENDERDARSSFCLSSFGVVALFQPIKRRRERELIGFCFLLLFFFLF